MRRDIGGVSLFLVHDSRVQVPSQQKSLPWHLQQMVVFLPPTRKDIFRKDGSLSAGAELYLSALGTGLDLVLMGWGTAEMLSGQRHLLFRAEDPVWLQSNRDGSADKGACG